MASYTPLLFHRRPSHLHHRGPTAPGVCPPIDLEDDMVSLYSVADVTLPRITARDLRRRDVQLRKIERSSARNPVSVVLCTLGSLLTNSMAYGTRRFNAPFTRALQ